MMQSSGRFEKENQPTKFIGFLLVGLSIFIVAWLVFKPAAQEVPIIWSLDEKWDVLETSAHNLQGDAYLTAVSFSWGSQSPYASPYAVTAEYHSMSVSHKTIFVGIDPFNKIDAAWVDSPPSSSGAHQPIHRDDWVIDSQEALSIFAKDEIVNTCLQSAKSLIDLSLNRVMTENASWVLHVFDCPNKGKYTTHYLDAQTGRIIDPFNP